MFPIGVQLCDIRLLIVGLLHLINPLYPRLKLIQHPSQARITFAAVGVRMGPFQVFVNFIYDDRAALFQRGHLGSRYLCPLSRVAPARLSGLEPIQ